VPARAPVRPGETRRMTDTITLTGIIATDPRVVTTEAGLDIVSFRLASTHRRFDRAKDEWVDGDTNWYTVTAFRALAANAGQSLHKGERVVVLGRLRVRAWEAGDRSGTTVEVDADAIGHDLRWGRSSFTRATAVTAQAASAETGAGGAGQDAATPAAPEAPAAADAWATGVEPAPDETAPGGSASDQSASDGSAPGSSAPVGDDASRPGVAADRVLSGPDDPPF
jgi:single-strand DNA-binding protein